VAVPDVVGLGKPAAVEAIFAAGLVPVPVDVCDDQTTGRIFASDPPAGTRVAEGSTVTISASISNKHPKCKLKPRPGPGG
jgi:beta-lactam-binding protein with PASTA domain